MARVLVIDDDAGTLFGYKHILRAAGHEVATAALGEDGTVAAQRDHYDVVLCDQRLPDRPGVEVVAEIRRSCPQTSIVLVTAWGTPALVIEAMRNGATSYAEKPLIGDELLTVVDEALRRRESGFAPAITTPIGYAAQRWADLVMRTSTGTDDVKTVSAWCRTVGLARSTLKAWCKAADVTPKNSVAFTRLFHVALHHSGEPWNLQRRLDIIDRRTAEALIRRAGFAPDSPIPDPESFLSQQRLIVSEELIIAIRERSKRGQGHH